jgi:AcrR family transcriptional regulator
MGGQTGNPEKLECQKLERQKIGRPRAFSELEALDAAMRVFWEKGYEGTTLDDLTRAMNINRSSLYATFGDKENLFRQVIRRYSSGPMASLWEALERPTARSVVETLLRTTVNFLADPSHPQGCLTLQGGMACGSGAQTVRRTMIDWRKSGLSRLQKRFQRAHQEGELTADVDPKDLARYILIVMNGLGVQAANGATKTEMTRAVEMALRSMPL